MSKESDKKQMQYIMDTMCNPSSAEKQQAHNITKQTVENISKALGGGSQPVDIHSTDNTVTASTSFTSNSPISTQDYESAVTGEITKIVNSIDASENQ